MERRTTISFFGSTTQHGSEKHAAKPPLSGKGPTQTGTDEHGRTQRGIAATNGFFGKKEEETTDGTDGTDWQGLSGGDFQHLSQRTCGLGGQDFFEKIDEISR